MIRFRRDTHKAELTAIQAAELEAKREVLNKQIAEIGAKAIEAFPDRIATAEAAATSTRQDRARQEQRAQYLSDQKEARNSFAKPLYVSFANTDARMTRVLYNVSSDDAFNSVPVEVTPGIDLQIVRKNEIDQGLTKKSYELWFMNGGGNISIGRHTDHLHHSVVYFDINNQRMFSDSDHVDALFNNIQLSNTQPQYADEQISTRNGLINAFDAIVSLIEAKEGLREEEIDPDKVIAAMQFIADPPVDYQ